MLASCTGQLGRPIGELDPGGPATGSGGTSPTGTGGAQPPGGSACQSVDIHPGRTPLRRLNRAEYRNTLYDLFPTLTSVIDTAVATFPLDEEQLGFTNNADALTVTGFLAEEYMTTAETVAAEAVKNLTALLPCSPAAIGEDACAQQFINDFGRRALRRPLTTAESARIFAVYTEGKKDGFDQGVSLGIAALLESPHFLYRPETGIPTATAGALALTPYEMATRLSYFLWRSMPDSTLLDAAQAGKLGTVAEITAQAKRMLADAKAHNAAATFHSEWIGIGTLGDKTKDKMLFPEWTVDIVGGLFQEVSSFVDAAFWTEGTSDRFFTAPYTFVDASLAKFYGMTPPSGTGFVKTDVDVTQRAGILTQGALMAIFSYDNQTSPIHRGKFVRERLLCQELQPPPPEIAAKVKPPVVDPTLSTRDRFAAHSSVAVCASCHQMMDPIGLGFENFDPIGRWRTKDGMFDVDATGEVRGTTDADGKFNGAVELEARLAKSREVRECIVTQWFRFANGRAETDLDQCTLASLKQTFESGGHDMRDIPVTMVLSDAFRYRAADGGGQ